MVILPNCYYISRYMVTKKNYHITKYSNFISDYLPYCKKYGKHIPELPYFTFMVILNHYHISNNMDFIEKIKLLYY